jgi:radical SAM protein with 4Fe4S-binding SPASM domain
VPAPKLKFTCNVNDPGKTRTPPGETEAVRRFLSRFGERVVLGFNIYRLDFELDFLFEYILEFGLARNIRLGVAHPIVGTKNRYIPVEKFREVVDRVFSYRDRFERLRVRPGFDCGFPMCKFTDEELAWLYRNTPGRYDFGCGPVVDIGPDLTVWPCFPLSSFQRRSLLEFNTFEELHEFYMELHRKVRVEVAGLYLECDSCRAREDELCRGGCIAHNVVKFQEEEPKRVKEVYL